MLERNLLSSANRPRMRKISPAHLQKLFIGVLLHTGAEGWRPFGQPASIRHTSTAGQLR